MGGSPPIIPGMKQGGENLQRLRYEVAELLDQSSARFPGAQPVSFAARHMLELQTKDYYLCEKSDGIRCLLYLTSEGPVETTYLIDRKNDYYLVRENGLHFPKEIQNPIPFHTQTVLDGELVNDALPNGAIQLMYLVFDCLVLDGDRLMHQTLDKRLAYYKDKVDLPYQTLFAAYPSEKEHQEFLVDWKKMERAYGIEMMFKDTLPKLRHGNDGLIFTCRTTPYKCGTDPHILKWKPAEENSIDFRMTVDFPIVEAVSNDEDPCPDYDANPAEIRLAVNGEHEEIPYGTLQMTPSEWEELKAQRKPLNDQIVECSLIEGTKWRFMRFRNDKKEANYIDVVESVMESIQDKVSEADLIGAAQGIRNSWKRREKEAEEKKAALIRQPTNVQNGLT